MISAILSLLLSLSVPAPHRSETALQAPAGNTCQPIDPSYQDLCNNPKVTQ